jgi:hypothetical protein
MASALMLSANGSPSPVALGLWWPWSLERSNRIHSGCCVSSASVPHLGVTSCQLHFLLPPFPSYLIAISLKIILGRPGGSYCSLHCLLAIPYHGIQALLASHHYVLFVDFHVTLWFYFSLIIILFIKCCHSRSISAPHIPLPSSLLCDSDHTVDSCYKLNLFDPEYSYT